MKKYGSMVDGEIPRSIVKKMKERFGMTDFTDGDFIEWWRRNHGTGYPIEIIDG